MGTESNRAFRTPVKSPTRESKKCSPSRNLFVQPHQAQIDASRERRPPEYVIVDDLLFVKVSTVSVRAT